MMIPTRGASTSISSNAASTSGIGSRVAGTLVSVSVLGSRCISTSLLSGLDGVHGACRDVGTHLLAVEVDHVGRLVGPVARLGRRRAQRGRVQHPAAGGDDLARLV